MNDATRLTEEHRESDSSLSTSTRWIRWPQILASIPVVLAFYLLFTAPEQDEALNGVLSIYGLSSAFFYGLALSLQTGRVRYYRYVISRRTKPWVYWGLVGLLAFGSVLLFYGMIQMALEIWNVSLG